MKAAQTIRVIQGQETEQAWIYEAPWWIEVNRLPSSLQDAQGIRKLFSKERTSKLVDVSKSISVWTLE